MPHMFPVLRLPPGCDVHYVHPECDEEFGVAHGIEPTKLSQTLEGIASNGRQAGAVLVVSPTYFGACSDVAGVPFPCIIQGSPCSMPHHMNHHMAPEALIARQGQLCMECCQEALAWC